MIKTLHYNRTTGKVYWAVGTGSKEITVYSFNPDEHIRIDRANRFAGAWSGVSGRNKIAMEINATTWTMSWPERRDLSPVSGTYTYNSNKAALYAWDPDIDLDDGDTMTISGNNSLNVELGYIEAALTRN
jgi:hypothetical protein